MIGEAGAQAPSSKHAKSPDFMLQNTPVNGLRQRGILDATHVQTRKVEKSAD
jgi:hypothetical protein